MAIKWTIEPSPMPSPPKKDDFASFGRHLSDYISVGDSQYEADISRHGPMGTYVVGLWLGKEDAFREGKFTALETA